jgi:hypothetical protein
MAHAGCGIECTGRPGAQEPAGGLTGALVADVDAARLSVYTRRVFAFVGIHDASFHSLRHTGANWKINGF